MPEQPKFEKSTGKEGEEMAYRFMKDHPLLEGGKDKRFDDGNHVVDVIFLTRGESVEIQLTSKSSKTRSLALVGEK